MSPYHRHALSFRPEPQRPVCYRTHRTLLQRLRPLVLAVGALGAIAVLALGVAALIARMYATQAQLDAAFIQGLAAAQARCEVR